MSPARTFQTAVLLSVALLAWAAPAAARPGFLVRGFTDDDAFRGLSKAGRSLSLSRARSGGAGFVRLGVAWRAIAPAGARKPRGFRASDPADPRYAWAELDRAVTEADAAGLSSLVAISYAPSWAEGRDRPRRTNRFTRPGVWKPRLDELAAFMGAAARRYSGRFPDPAGPGVLPQVRHWQIWNEPNLWPFLQPQWQRRGRRWVKPAAHHYRRMLNVSYRALKRVDPANRVIAGGLAPFGEFRPTRVGGRIAPARFLRAALCLRGRRRLEKACGGVARFDAYSFHPYSLGGPKRTALNPDDTTIPDAHKLRRVVAAALRFGTAAPRAGKELWATEMGWDTRPPNPFGLRPWLQARYINDSLFVLWRGGVSHAINFLMRDRGGKRARRLVDPQRRQSGVWFRGSAPRRDRAKPSFLSVRFPFVVLPRGGGRGRAWGAPPCEQPCRIVIEYRTRAGWKAADTFTAGGGRVFLRTIPVSRRTVFRARVPDSGVVSLTTLPRTL